MSYKLVLVAVVVVANPMGLHKQTAHWLCTLDQLYKPILTPAIFRLNKQGQIILSYANMVLQKWKLWFTFTGCGATIVGAARLNRKTGFDFLPQFLPIKMSGSWQIWRLLVRLKKLHSQERLNLIESGRKILPPIHDKFNLKLVTNLEKCDKSNPRQNPQRKPAPMRD